MITIKPVHIPSPVADDQALILSQGPLRRVREHYVVPGYVLVYVVEGQGEYEREDTGQRWPVTAGSILQRFPGVSHRVAFETLVPKQIHLIVPKAMYDLLYLSGYGVDDAVWAPNPQYGEILKALSSHLEGVSDYPSALGVYQQAITQMLIIAHDQSPHAKGHWLDQVQRYLIRHMETSLSMEATADAFDMAYVTFRRKFKQETGESPFAWLLRQRLMRAQDLLRSTELSVQAIARFCGFQTIYTFSHAFKERFGQSPSQYRLAEEMSG